MRKNKKNIMGSIYQEQTSWQLADKMINELMSHMENEHLDNSLDQEEMQ